MDELVRDADRLEQAARRLVNIDPDATGRLEKPEHDLGHAVIRWALALRDLESSGRVAAETADSWFSRSQGETVAANPLGVELAELHLNTAYLAGDTVLDALAWAELYRRGRRSARDGSGKVIATWSTFVHEVERDGPASMLAPVRYLDLTLDPARDALVAHRDPELWTTRGMGNVGPFTLSMLTADQTRLRAGVDALGSVLETLVPSAFIPRLVDRSSADSGSRVAALRTLFDERLTAVIALAARVPHEGRQVVRQAYRDAGMDSPGLSPIVGEALTLIGLHLDARPELSQQTPT